MVKRTPPAGGSSGHNPSAEADVDAFMAALDHPDKPAIEALRQIILDADPRIREGIKWNAPSFHQQDWFATVHLRSRQGLQVIFHLGAKVKDVDARTVTLKVPNDLLHWLSRDRCLVKFADTQDLQARKTALQEFVRQWLELL